ncbi:DUF2703 domain-containing protein [Thermanaerovibrio acidaminovorans]|nr:DUF2703 domain-containing protein [Thermanaerovibrio acidaminovorans]
MASIVVAHYGIGDGDCGCFKRTRENLLHVLERMAPKFAALGIEISAEHREMEDSTENRTMHNLITLESPGEMDETSLESLLGLEVEMLPCDDGGSCRAIVMEGAKEGAKFQEVPTGLIMDGLIRASMKLLGGHHQCGSCGCCH